MIGWVGDYYNPVDRITYTRLSALREVNWDVKTHDLVANPVPELLNLRSGTVASEHIAALPANSVPHVIAKTGAGAAASSDIVLKFSGFKASVSAPLHGDRSKWSALHRVVFHGSRSANRFHTDIRSILILVV